MGGGITQEIRNAGVLLYRVSAPTLQLPHFKLLRVRGPHSLPETRPRVSSRAEESGDWLVGVETYSCIFRQSTLVYGSRINSRFLVLGAEVPEN